ncbi:MAG: hypothetical protein JSS00_00080 [Proteobacteria bacterium]|nr:hypothetical protein [Pseudomonadota bacterium]
MSDIRLTLSEDPPETPMADFAFYIDFKRGTGSPSRVFTATSEFIRACERFDRELLKSIDSRIETVLILEDIEAGSLKTWLRNQLVAADDDALKKMDWKRLVGKYLVDAKYAALRFLDDGSAPRELPKLSREIQQIAAATDVRHLPDYAPPSPRALLDALKDFQSVKDALSIDDRAKYIAGERQLEINLSVRWNVDEIEALAVKQVMRSPPSPMILAVKKPDYLGNSQWDVRLGRRTIQAKIQDSEWLRRFQNREIDVRPGDALQCMVEVEHLYGHDNELIAEHYTVLSVDNVLQNQMTQSELFDEEERK